MQHPIVKYTDLAFAIALVVAGVISLRYIKDPAAAAGLAGALFGGAAILFGNWINRMYEARRAVEDLGRRRSSLRKLIAAELVTTAVGYLNAKRETATSLSPGASHVAGVFAPVLSAIGQNLPRSLALTGSLGTELLILEESAIDALITFQGCLAMTRMNVDHALERGPLVSRLVVMGIDSLVAHDMGLLAECFEKIAPTRKMQMPDKQPELASELLRLVAAERP
jgi:hypothetical protein